MSKELIETFYTAFAALDADKMSSCYHDRLSFSDPVFPQLNAQQTKGMWSMLTERAKNDLEVTYHSVIADHERGACIWEA
ncbi:MAG: nuclear transport factor 2 family protein, partial [Bacteroidota bacterium]